MTLPLNDRVTSTYTADGTNKEFNFDFRVFFNVDTGSYGLEVRKVIPGGYEVISPSAYTVVPNEDLTAGKIVFTTAPIAGTEIYLAGKTPTVQQLNLTNYGRFSAEAIEVNFDFLTAIIQEWLTSLSIETAERKENDLLVNENTAALYAQWQAWAETNVPDFAAIYLDSQIYDFRQQWIDALNSIANGIIPAIGVSTLNGENQQQVNDRIGNTWYDKPLGYELNSRVLLTNGDIVKSTTPNNTINPNVDMTGWENKEKEQDKINNLLPTYADKSASLQAAISNATNGDTINLSGKTYPSGIDVGSKHLVGTGYNTVINVPSSGYGIKSTQSLPTWNRYEIRNLTLKGTAKTGTGFTFDPLDEVSGRRNLSYVSFSELDIGINKPSGNIGNTYSNCNFDQCNYGFKAVQNTGALMHSGCDTFRDAQFSNIKKWAIDITNLSDGGGQFSIQDSIIQFCQGGGIRIDYGNTIPFCPIEIRNVWFEGVATSATVNRDGVDEVPREIKIINTPMAVIDGCYLKNIELINSTVIARACRVDNSAEFPNILVDNTSQLIAEDLYANGYVPSAVTVRSIATQKRATPNPLIMRGQQIKGITKKPYNSFSAVGRTFSGTAGATTFDILGSLTVQASCVVDDGISGTCAELNLTSGVTSLLGSHQLIAGKWAVWGISVKAISGIAGTFKFKNEFELGSLIMSEGEWVHNFGVAKVGVTGFVSAWFEPSQAGVIRFANYFVVQFDTEAEAIAFANSRLAVDTIVREVVVAYDPPSLAASALQTTTVTLTGARIGEPVNVSFDLSLQGTLMWGSVTANDTVTVYHKNTNSTTVDVVAGKLRVKLI